MPIKFILVYHTGIEVRRGPATTHVPGSRWPLAVMPSDHLYPGSHQLNVGPMSYYHTLNQQINQVVHSSNLCASMEASVPVQTLYSLHGSIHTRAAYPVVRRRVLVFCLGRRWLNTGLAANEVESANELLTRTSINLKIRHLNPCATLHTSTRCYVLACS